MAGTLCPSARTSRLALVTAGKLASAITSSSPCPIWAIRYKSSGERMLGMRFNMVFFLDRGVILARVARHHEIRGLAQRLATYFMVAAAARRGMFRPWLARCSPQNNLPARQRHPSSKETPLAHDRGLCGGESR